MQVSFSPEFRRQLSVLQTRGGVAQRVARQVDEICGRMSMAEGGHPSTFGNLTHHGESRIPHCYKYDLQGRYRFVCIANDNIIHLIFVGDHEETDRWIENHRGFRVAVSDRTRRATPIREIDFETIANGAALPSPRLDLPAREYEHLLDHVTISRLLAAGLGDGEIQLLRRCDRFSNDDDIIRACDAPRYQHQKDLLLSIAVELRDRNIDAAQALIDRFRGEASDLAEASAEKAHSTINAPENTDVFFSLRDLSADELEKALGGADFHDWLLFLHPDQKPVVDLSAKRTLLLRGVPGSGKTSVLVHRARAMARRYPTDRIAVVALNPALAALLRKLVSMLCTEREAARIDVLSMEELCKRIIAEYSPEQKIQTHDPRNDETLEDCWTETWTQPETQDDLQPIVKSLEKQKVDAERYIRDEMIWVRSAVSKGRDGDPGSKVNGRASYAGQMARQGRKIAFLPQWRERLLRALERYESYCEAGAFFDSAAVTLLAHTFIGRLENDRRPELTFRAVLVDEVQDLGTIELEILNRLALRTEDALFLVGDPEQQVFPKAFDLSAAGIQPDHRPAFKRNFRNPRQILEAAEALAQAFAGDTDEARLQPEYAARECARPLATAMPDEQSEITQVAFHLRAELDQRPSSVVCVAVCGLRDDDEHALTELAKRYRAAGLQVRLLRSDTGLDGGTAFLSSLETIKGFEFSTIVVTRCGANEIPVPSLPEEESWRDARRLYVAFTRARDQLVLTWSGEPSRFVRSIESRLQFGPLVGDGGTPSAAPPPPQWDGSAAAARDGAPVPAPAATAEPAPVAPSPAPSPASSQSAPSAPLESVLPSPSVSPEPVTPSPTAVAPATTSEPPRPVSSSDETPITSSESIDSVEFQSAAGGRRGPRAPAAGNGPSSVDIPLAERIAALGVVTIDKRPQGGALWVVDLPNRPSLERELREACKGQGEFQFARNGSKGTKNRPAWWLRPA